MQEEIPMFVQLCGVGRSGRKALYGVHPNKASISRCSEPHETMRKGFYYLKFLTADYGLWF